MSTEGVTSDGGMDEADGSEARVSIPLRNGLVEGSAGEEKSFLRSIGNRDDVDIGEKTTRARPQQDAQNDVSTPPNTPAPTVDPPSPADASPSSPRSPTFGRSPLAIASRRRHPTSDTESMTGPDTAGARTAVFIRSADLPSVSETQAAIASRSVVSERLELEESTKNASDACDVNDIATRSEASFAFLASADDVMGCSAGRRVLGQPSEGATAALSASSFVGSKLAHTRCSHRQSKNGEHPELAGREDQKVEDEVIASSTMLGLKDTIRAAVNAPNQEVEPGGGACERFQQNRVIGSCCAIQSRNSRTKEDKGALKPAVDPHATALSSLKAGSFRGRTYPSRGWTVPPIPSATSFETDILIREAGGDRQGGKRIDAHPTAADRDKGNEVDRQRWEGWLDSDEDDIGVRPILSTHVDNAALLDMDDEEWGAKGDEESGKGSPSSWSAPSPPRKGQTIATKVFPVSPDFDRRRSSLLSLRRRRGSLIASGRTSQTPDSSPSTMSSTRRNQLGCVSAGSRLSLLSKEEPTHGHGTPVVIATGADGANSSQQVEQTRNLTSQTSPPDAPTITPGGGRAPLWSSGGGGLVADLYSADAGQAVVTVVTTSARDSTEPGNSSGGGGFGRLDSSVNDSSLSGSSSMSDPTGNGETRIEVHDFLEEFSDAGEVESSAGEADSSICLGTFVDDRRGGTGCIDGGQNNVGIEDSGEEKMNSSCADMDVGSGNGDSARESNSIGPQMGVLDADEIAFLVNNQDLREAMFSVEDLHFGELLLKKQVELMSDLSIVNFERNDIIFREGEPSHAFYFILDPKFANIANTAGEGDVSKESNQGGSQGGGRRAEDNAQLTTESERHDGVEAERTLVSLPAGRAFGEEGLVYRTEYPRSSTVRAAVEMSCAVVQSPVFPRWWEFRLYLLMKKVPLLAKLPPTVQTAVLRALHFVDFERGNLIIKEGETGDKFYMITQGTVTVSVRIPDKPATASSVCTSDSSARAWSPLGHSGAGPWDRHGGRGDGDGSTSSHYTGDDNDNRTVPASNITAIQTSASPAVVCLRVDNKAGRETACGVPCAEIEVAGRDGGGSHNEDPAIASRSEQHHQAPRGATDNNNGRVDDLNEALEVDESVHSNERHVRGGKNVVNTAVRDATETLASIAAQSRDSDVERTAVVNENVGEAIPKMAKPSEGCSWVHRSNPSAETTGEKILTRLYEGNSFGEIALIYDEPRNASVRAVTEVACFYLKKEDFRRCLYDKAFHKLMEQAALQTACYREQRALRPEFNTSKKASRSSTADGVEYPTSYPGDSARTLRSKTSAARSSFRCTMKMKPASPNAKADGRVVNDYRVGRKVGEGSFGAVYRVVHIPTRQVYAMKVIKKPRNGGQRREHLERSLRREVSVMQTLRHPNVVALWEVINDPRSRKVYMIEEFMEGGGLLKEKYKVEPIPEHIAISKLVQALRGLHYIHSNGICHGDIKPSNILEDAHGKVKIADFGACVVLNQDDEDGDGDISCSGSSVGSHTEGGRDRERRRRRKKRGQRVGGTPGFQAPELFGEGGASRISFASDVWALGVTLYQMVVGKMPFFGPSYRALMASIQMEALTFPARYQMEPYLVNLLHRMLDKNPATRITLVDIMCHEWVTREGVSPPGWKGDEVEACRSITSSESSRRSQLDISPRSSRCHSSAGRSLSQHGGEQSGGDASISPRSRWSLSRGTPPLRWSIGSSERGEPTGWTWASRREEGRGEGGRMSNVDVEDELTPRQSSGSEKKSPVAIITVAADGSRSGGYVEEARAQNEESRGHGADLFAVTDLVSNARITKRTRVSERASNDGGVKVASEFLTGGPGGGNRSRLSPASADTGTKRPGCSFSREKSVLPTNILYDRSAFSAVSSPSSYNTDDSRQPRRSANSDRQGESRLATSSGQDCTQWGWRVYDRQVDGGGDNGRARAGSTYARAGSDGSDGGSGNMIISGAPSFNEDSRRRSVSADGVVDKRSMVFLPGEMYNTQKITLAQPPCSQVDHSALGDMTSCGGCAEPELLATSSSAPSSLPLLLPMPTAFTSGEQQQGWDPTCSTIEEELALSQRSGESSPLSVSSPLSSPPSQIGAVPMREKWLVVPASVYEVGAVGKTWLNEDEEEDRNNDRDTCHDDDGGEQTASDDYDAPPPAGTVRTKSPREAFQLRPETGQKLHKRQRSRPQPRQQRHLEQECQKMAGKRQQRQQQRRQRPTQHNHCQTGERQQGPVTTVVSPPPTLLRPRSLPCSSSCPRLHTPAHIQSTLSDLAEVADKERSLRQRRGLSCPDIGASFDNGRYPHDELEDPIALERSQQLVRKPDFLMLKTDPSSGSNTRVVLSAVKAFSFLRPSQGGEVGSRRSSVWQGHDRSSQGMFRERPGGDNDRACRRVSYPFRTRGSAPLRLDRLSESNVDTYRRVALSDGCQSELQQAFEHNSIGSPSEDEQGGPSTTAPRLSSRSNLQRGDNNHEHPHQHWTSIRLKPALKVDHHTLMTKSATSAPARATNNNEESEMLTTGGSSDAIEIEASEELFCFPPGRGCNRNKSGSSGNRNSNDSTSNHLNMNSESSDGTSGESGHPKAAVGAETAMTEGGGRRSSLPLLTASSGVDESMGCIDEEHTDPLDLPLTARVEPHMLGMTSGGVSDSTGADASKFTSPAEIDKPLDTDMSCCRTRALSAGGSEGYGGGVCSESGSAGGRGLGDDRAVPARVMSDNVVRAQTCKHVISESGTVKDFINAPTQNFMQQEEGTGGGGCDREDSSSDDGVGDDVCVADITECLEGIGDSGTEREDEDLWPLDREEILALATGTAHRNASPSFAAPSERESGSGEWTKLAKSTSRTGTNAYIGHVQARGWAGQANLHVGVRFGLSLSQGSLSFMEDTAACLANAFTAERESPWGTPREADGLARGSVWTQGTTETSSAADTLAHAPATLTAPLPEAAAYFAVFDGHGGADVALRLQDVLHHKILEDPHFPLNIPEAIVSGCLTTDLECLEACHVKRLTNSETLQKESAFPATSLKKQMTEQDFSGAVAVIAIVHRPALHAAYARTVPALGLQSSPPVFLHVANVGDCRAVLCRAGEAVVITEDHTPSIPSEAARVEAAGGFVSRGRVNGILGVSRSFGDIHCKVYPPRGGHNLWEGQQVISRPEVHSIELTDADNFLILACDGIWDVLSSQQAVSYVHRRLLAHRDVQRAAVELVDKALVTSSDNCSCIVVCLNQVVSGAAKRSSYLSPRKNNRGSGRRSLPSGNGETGSVGNVGGDTYAPEHTGIMKCATSQSERSAGSETEARGGESP